MAFSKRQSTKQLKIQVAVAPPRPSVYLHELLLTEARNDLLLHSVLEKLVSPEPQHANHFRNRTHDVLPNSRRRNQHALRFVT